MLQKIKTREIRKKNIENLTSLELWKNLEPDCLAGLWDVEAVETGPGQCGR